MELSAFEKRAVARTFKPDSKLGKFDLIGLRLWIVASLFLADQIVGRYLFLPYFYGFSRVYKEGLHITNLPLSPQRADDLEVSNGDHISYVDQFIGLPLTLGVWFVLIVIGYLVIKLISRWRKETVYKKTLKKIYDA